VKAPSDRCRRLQERGISEGLGFVFRALTFSHNLFLPSLLAQHRDHENASAIGALNEFLA